MEPGRHHASNAPNCPICIRRTVQPSAQREMTYSAGTRWASIPITLSECDRSAAVTRDPPFGTVAGSPLLCQEAAPAWVLWARHVPFCCDYVTIANRIVRRPGNAPPGRNWLAGAGQPAHSLDERHQDLIRDRGEQLTGRR
jgi:hypothetical protein